MILALPIRKLLEITFHQAVKKVNRSLAGILCGILVLSSIPYKIIYEIDGDTISILSIFHTSRNP